MGWNLTGERVKIYAGIDIAKDKFDYCAMIMPSIFYAREALRKTGIINSGKCRI